MTTRKAEITRRSRETEVSLSLNLDGQGHYQVDTGIPFFNHMLEQLAFHALIDLKLHCAGDLEVDSHHTVEDVGLALGAALDDALGTRAGIRRYGHCYCPMDESLLRVALDCSGRPEFCFQGGFTHPALGALPTEMIPHFFKSVANAARLTLHMTVLYGENDHHKCEGLFKAFARALDDAVAPEPRRPDIASTKGSL